LTEQPSLHVGLGFGDDAHAHHALGRPLRQGERDQRAAEAENRRKYQQATESAPGQTHAENLLDDENT